MHVMVLSQAQHQTPCPVKELDRKNVRLLIERPQLKPGQSILYHGATKVLPCDRITRLHVAQLREVDAGQKT